MKTTQTDVPAKEKAMLAKSVLATKNDLELLKNELTIRVGAMIVGLAGFLSAISFFEH